MAEEKPQSLSLEEKLSTLDPNQFEMQKDKAQIIAWRDRVRDLNVMKDFVQHPGALRLVEAGESEIKRINSVLNTDRDLLLNPNRVGERAALLAERDIHQFYLDIFKVVPNIDNEMALIQKGVDLEFQPEE